MVIILKSNQMTLAEIPLYHNSFDQITFGDDKVKEISIVHEIKNSDEKALEELYKKISAVDYHSVNEVIVYYDKDTYFSFNAQVKGVYYRVLSYLRARNMELNEYLTIRFAEDNKVCIGRDEDFVFCDQAKCNYYKNNYCKKYNAELDTANTYNKPMICESCYLEMWPEIGRTFLGNMEAKYKK
ncbi:hypothetical protein M2140_000125 [Clostridiales Family XIII bacterium PM5-7]